MNPPASSFIGLSIDVEEWYHAPGFTERIIRRYKGNPPSTLEDGVERCLRLTLELKVKATFFVLGYLAGKFPEAILKIAEAGHEIACHGWDHSTLKGMSRRQLESDLARAKEALEDLTGKEISGYRAPAWSIPDKEWVYEVLAEKGFVYSSSVLPLYWLRGLTAGPFKSSGVLELPVLGLPAYKPFVPAGGTVTLRTLPVSLLESARDRSAGKKFPAIYWFHPWELVPGAPRIHGNPIFYLARFLKIKALPEKLRLLLPPGDLTLKKFSGLQAFKGGL